jgi:hypothetical protein
MADLRISQLPELITPATSDVIPIVNSGSTKKVTLQNLPVSTFVSSNSATWFDPINSFGPVTLLRFAAASFSNSGYDPVTKAGFFAATGSAGNTELGSASLANFYWFNPSSLLTQTTPFAKTYKITMVVRVTSSFNDSVHCRLKRITSGGSSIVSGLEDFGGGVGGAERIYFSTSNDIAIDNTQAYYNAEFAAYGPSGGSNGATIQDVVLIFYVS